MFYTLLFIILSIYFCSQDIGNLFYVLIILVLSTLKDSFKYELEDKEHKKIKDESLQDIKPEEPEQEETILIPFD